MTDLGAHDLTRGLNGELGFRLVEWREGFARVTVDLDERHKNRQGGLHGGVTAALVDAATGYCGVYEPDPEKRRSNVTVSLNVNFVSRPKGATLTCTAEDDSGRPAHLLCIGRGARRHRQPDRQRRGGLRLRRPRGAGTHDGPLSAGPDRNSFGPRPVPARGRAKPVESREQQTPPRSHRPPGCARPARSR